MSTQSFGLRLVAITALALVSSCGEDHQGSGSDDLAGADLTVGAAADGGVDLAIGDLAVGCPRLPKPDDAERKIVISHPYAPTSGSQAKDYEVLNLDSAGTITRPNVHFTMGRAAGGEIVFTPDGEVGFVVQQQGSIGVFRLLPGQPPEVIEAEHMRGLFAGRLWISPAGDHLYILDAETENNGGGVYDLPINCDGTLGATTLLSPADVPYALVGLPGGQAGLFARTLPGAAVGENAHLITLGPPFQRHASVVSFPQQSTNTVVYGAAVTNDGRYMLFGDTSPFSGFPMRVAAIEFTNGMLRPAQVLNILDPISIVASPYNNAALVSSGIDDALVVLGYDPANTTTPFTNLGKLAGIAPALPNSAVVIKRGALKGRIYVAENLGIHQARFETNGTVTNLGKYETGPSGFEQIVGAIGVQP